MKWQPYRQLHCAEPPRALKHWLLDRNSLTKRLLAASTGSFRVEVLRQHWGRARPDELDLLDCKARHRVLIREVLLYGHNTPWVYARSILPAASLDRSLRHLKRLGSKPLGAALFSDPCMRRSEIELAYLSPDELPISVAESVWGRRSVFYLHNQPLLVSEIFLPTFLSTAR